MIDKIRLLCSISDDMSAAQNSSELLNVINRYINDPDVCDDKDLHHILYNMQSLAERSVMFYTDNGVMDSIQQRIACLSELERIELDEVNNIIDNNLFNYHFQPIVDTKDGSIYSFEALMRPMSTLCKSPLSILKYAEITDRLADIEKATFMNVLSVINSSIDKIGNKHIFINSIPKVRIDKSDFDVMLPIMTKFSDNIVIEMTEQSEMNDDDLDDIKKTYSDIGIKFAIDDYGAGYSNVQNLIRYTPNYVKIDRSLISNVNNDPKKRHFVRDIIEFCHDNDIMALAEGVETQEELHTVISLGADLVQGYYTARPSADIIESVSEDIITEIKQCRKKLEKEKELGIYAANYIDKIRLNNIADDDYSCVQIKSNADHTDRGGVILTGGVSGSKGIHIDIEDGYHGDIILDNAVLYNTGNYPCIDIGENSDVTLILQHMNKLIHGGIKVPESSKLLIKGDGIIDISVDGSCFYAIGNDLMSRHGDVIFEQGVVIENDSVPGICIGSGLGGNIIFRSGKYELSMHGIDGVAIGSYEGDVNIDISSCDMSIDFNLQKGLGIGTVKGNAVIDISHTSIKSRLAGKDVVGFGCYDGDMCDVSVHDASVIMNLMIDDGAAIAAISGHTSINVERAGINIITNGNKALALGYSNDIPDLRFADADVAIKMRINSKYVDGSVYNKIDAQRGQTSVIANGTELYHE